MKQFYFSLFIVVCIVICQGCNKRHTDLIYDNSFKSEIVQTRKDFANFITMNYIPGGNIAIAKDGKIIYSEGIGMASKDLEVPMTRFNKLRIGDLSQIFTSIIYLKLVEEGVLEPDSTVQHYIADYPETSYPLAIKHLPYHTSGIRKNTPREDEWAGLNTTIKKGIETFMNDPLESPPGWYEEPSMFNTNLLGAIMEKATQMKFPELLKTYVTDTLNLTNTVVDNPTTTIIGRADFYDQNMMGTVINAPFRDTRYKAPSKGILSNAEDLVKLGMAILDSGYFSEEFRDNIFKQCDLYGGFKSNGANGWIVTSDNYGREVNGSNSIVTGGGAVILIYPEDKFVFAFAVNLTLNNNNLPVFEIANYFLSDPESDKK